MTLIILIIAGIIFVIVYFLIVKPKQNGATGTIVNETTHLLFQTLRTVDRV
jgi:capsular polysaccharide biosynthesis protein